MVGWSVMVHDVMVSLVLPACQCVARLGILCASVSMFLYVCGNQMSVQG